MDDSWMQVIGEEFEKPYMRSLRNHLVAEKKRKIEVYPPGPMIFRAFNTTPFDKVKVVILGQDPYHGPNQANGLCFSVSPGVRKPPSLENIYRECNNDLGRPLPDGGDLGTWAMQGVLMLNTTLTVRKGKPKSHAGFGWEVFTDAVIRALNEHHQHLVFLLWGSHAKAKAQMIDRSRHCILTAAHPSPYSADRGFFGCRHFSKANAYLTENGKDPINWTAEMSELEAAQSESQEP